MLRLLLYLAVALSLFVATWGSMRPLVHLLPALIPRQQEVLQWESAAAVALPFFFLLSRTVEQLVRAVAMTLLPSRPPEESEPVRFLRHTLLFVCSWLAAVVILAVTSPILPALVPLGVVGLGLVVSSYVFWESLTRFHAHIEVVLGTLSGERASTDRAAPSTEQTGRTAVTQLLRERYGLAVQTEDFIVPFSPTALNQSIQALGLRTRTGASIIAIYRDPEQIVLPQPDTVLLPGDVLVLLGEPEQLAAALRFLSDLARQPLGALTVPPQLASVVIAADSPFVDRTLADLGLRDQLGVLVIRVQRKGVQVTNPGPNFRVHVGDELYLWGAPEQVEQARRRAGNGAEDTDA